MPRPPSHDPDHYMYTSSSRNHGRRLRDRGYDSEDSQTLSSARLAQHNRVFEKDRLRKASAPQLDEDYRRQSHRRRRRNEDRHAESSPVIDASEQFLGVFRPRPSVNLTRSSYGDLRARDSWQEAPAFERPITPSRRRRSSSALRRDADSRRTDDDAGFADRYPADFQPVEVTSVIQLFGERPSHLPPALPPAPHRSHRNQPETVRRSSFASGRPESLYTADIFASGSGNSSKRRGSSTAGDSATPGARRSLFGKSWKRDAAPVLPSIHSGSAFSVHLEEEEDRHRRSSRYRPDLYSEDYLLPPQPDFSRSASRNSYQSSHRQSIDTRRSLSRDHHTTPTTVHRRTAALSGSQVSPSVVAQPAAEPLDPEMTTILSRFSSRQMGDHKCNRGYPIAVFCGAQSMDVGGITNSKVHGAYALFFGPGHPQNVQQPMTEGEIRPSHLQNPKPPTVAATGRRAELIATTRALQAVHELYRGKACAHICMDSAYVAKAWGSWIPKWEEEGWPGDEHVKKTYSGNSGNGSVAANGDQKKSNKRLADEDLLRELAAIRRLYARAERKNTGAAHLYLIDRNANPANKPCRLVLENVRLRGVSPPPNPGAMSPRRRESKTYRRSMQSDVPRSRRSMQSDVPRSRRSVEVTNDTTTRRDSRRESLDKRTSRDLRPSRSSALQSKRRSLPVAEGDESNISDVAVAPLRRRVSVKSAASAVTALDEDEAGGARPAVTALEGVEPTEEDKNGQATESKGVLASGIALLSAYSGGLLSNRSPASPTQEPKKVEAAVPDSEVEDEDVPAYTAGQSALVPTDKKEAIVPADAVASTGRSSKSPILEEATPIIKKSKSKRASARRSANGQADSERPVIASPTKDGKRRKSKASHAAIETPSTPPRRSGENGRKSISKRSPTMPVAAAVPDEPSDVAESSEETEANNGVASPRRSLAAERRKSSGVLSPVVVAQNGADTEEEGEDLAPTPKARSGSPLAAAKKKSEVNAASIGSLRARAPSVSDNVTDSEAEAGISSGSRAPPKRSSIFTTRKRPPPAAVPVIVPEEQVSPKIVTEKPVQKKGGFFSLFSRSSSSASVPAVAPAATAAPAQNGSLQASAAKSSAPVAATPQSEVSAATTDVTGDTSEDLQSAVEAPSPILEEDEEAEGQATPVPAPTPAAIPVRALSSPEPPSGGRLVNYGRRRAERQAALAAQTLPAASPVGVTDVTDGPEASVVTVDEAAQSELDAAPSSSGVTPAVSAAPVAAAPSRKTVRKQSSMPAARRQPSTQSLTPSAQSSKSHRRLGSLSMLGGRKSRGPAPEEEEWAGRSSVDHKSADTFPATPQKKRGFLPWGRKNEKAPPVPAIPADVLEKRRQPVNTASRAAVAEPARKSMTVAEDSAISREEQQSEIDTDILVEETEPPSSDEASRVGGGVGVEEPDEAEMEQVEPPPRPRSRLLSFAASPAKRSTGTSGYRNGAAAPPPPASSSSSSTSPFAPASPAPQARGKPPPPRERVSLKKKLSNLVTME